MPITPTSVNASILTEIKSTDEIKNKTSIPLVRYAEMMHSDWSKEVTRLEPSNRSTLFQRSMTTLKFVNDIGS